jgi:hypothetical protein
MIDYKWSNGPISDGGMDPRNKPEQEIDYPPECTTPEMELAYAAGWWKALEVKRNEMVVTKNHQGQIVAVTRQDEEGRILSVIAESSERVPVAWMRGEHTPSDSQWGYYSPMKCYDDDIPLYR